jgi:hypothetical protein
VGRLMLPRTHEASFQVYSALGRNVSGRRALNLFIPRYVARGT